ncbi:hypothetical protein BDK51DRAFT_52029 [Blyttiomyces helicus]|uniref:ATPase n=1 Tax=Blyttiomyces helicus TaxID=388810 RepID=A0A4P9WHK8_9FUNG|nr:hypothetical protein BDK51DRAFT_52029 [Blyttiomyces helicus]|eukprot:RKO90908.1 hypothetical protein BDK51DRAFT_52029 [Blyttiomyces helicus]
MSYSPYGWCRSPLLVATPSLRFLNVRTPPLTAFLDKAARGGRVYGGGSRGCQGGGGGGGGGGGRGAYYKVRILCQGPVTGCLEKYGGGNSRSTYRDSDGPSRLTSAPFLSESASSSSGTTADLAALLRSIDGTTYGAYKRLKGTWTFPNGVQLIVDHVQADSFAAPSKMRVKIPQQLAEFDLSLFSTRNRRISLEDYLTRRFWEYVHKMKLDVGNPGGSWGSNKGADFNIDKPGQQVLERSSMSVSEDYIEARFTIGLPARGRSVLGHQATTLLMENLPEIVVNTMVYSALDANHLRLFIECLEDQESLRGQLDDAGLIAFVPNGAILPRESGASDHPMRSSDVVKFESPPSLLKEFLLPNRGRIVGMGIPTGVTLIAGGGFHGKSTLLDALQFGVYNHVPGDGREFVAVEKSVAKIRAEDGRYTLTKDRAFVGSITSVNISPFIKNLPHKKDTANFNTDDASGSTSMAGNIQESLEIGCRGLLIDEDTAATNFLVRDHRMQLLVAHEPITPLISKIEALHYEQGCSTILVIGGCGSYLDVADLVIAMDSYVPKDLTAKAKEIAAQIPVGTEAGIPYGEVTSRIPILPKGPSNSTGPATFSRPPKSAARRTNLITFSGIDVDLSALEQLVHTSQARCILEALLRIRDRYGATGLTVREVVARVEKEWDDAGLAAGSVQGWIAGDLARPRAIEIAGALNRVRGLAVRRG